LNRVSIYNLIRFIIYSKNFYPCADIYVKTTGAVSETQRTTNCKITTLELLEGAAKAVESGFKNVQLMPFTVIVEPVKNHLAAGLCRSNTVRETLCLSVAGTLVKAIAVILAPTPEISNTVPFTQLRDNEVLE
jgi:hypothetical protein